MIKIFTFISALFISTLTFAQAPEKMSFQAVVRNSSNELLKNQTVGMQVSILQGSVSGSIVYSETQTPKCNSNGLVSIEIGTGTTTHDFSAITWENGPFFIKIDMDPTGGTNYTITGTTQLLRAPYALYAKSAGSVDGLLNISAQDTAHWNDDNVLDSTGIANLYYVAGPHN